MTALQAILHIGLFAFAYYENTLSPASLGRVEITDGVKTVVFQQMSHIASASFYDEVRQDIERASASGYTIFYEWIGTGSEASSKVLDTALGIRFDSGTYTSVADMIGMREQDYRYLFSGIRSLSWVINVDLSLDEVARLYSKLPVSSPEQKPAPIDITRELSGALDALRPEERLTLRYIARSFLNLMLKNNQDFLSSEIGSFLASDIMSVILEDRNEHIAETILSSKSDKIYALYGALHFEGIFQKLQKSNPAWKIVRVESMRPY